jgi:DNA polymerase III psi subunit
VNKDTINQSLIYDELGLSPIWVLGSSKTQTQETTHSSNEILIYLKRIKLQKHNVLFIAPIHSLSDDSELDLLKRISTYLDTLCDKSEEVNELEKIEKSEFLNKLGDSEYLVFLDDQYNNSINIKSLTIPSIASVSLKEMVENPERKRKLWQDIKKLLKLIN